MSSVNAIGSTIHSSAVLKLRENRKNKQSATSTTKLNQLSQDNIATNPTQQTNSNTGTIPAETGIIRSGGKASYGASRSASGSSSSPSPSQSPAPSTSTPSSPTSSTTTISTTTSQTQGSGTSGSAYSQTSSVQVAANSTSSTGSSQSLSGSLTLTSSTSGSISSTSQSASLSSAASSPIAVAPSNSLDSQGQIIQQAFSILAQQSFLSTQDNAPCSIENGQSVSSAPNRTSSIWQQGHSFLHMFGAQKPGGILNLRSLANRASQNGLQALALDRAAQQYRSAQMMATHVATDQAHQVLDAISNVRDMLNPSMGMQTTNAQGLADALKTVFDGYKGLVGDLQSGSQFFIPDVVSTIMSPIHDEIYGSFIGGDIGRNESMSAAGSDSSSFGNFLNQLENKAETIATRPMEAFVAQNPYEGQAALVRKMGAEFYSSMSKTLFSQQMLQSLFDIKV